jgi:hypothetical protein
MTSGQRRRPVKRDGSAEICSESGIAEIPPTVSSNNIARLNVWLPEELLEDDLLVKLKVTCTRM